VKLGPEVMAEDARAIDGSAAFVVLPLPNGPTCFCKSCGAEALIRSGLIDARELRHVAGCRVGQQIATSPKPVFLRHSGESKN
jgi:hypothetical protein